MDNDRIIIEQILNGHGESFALLVDRYYHKITAFLCKMGAGREDSEDLAQEIFIKVYNNLYKYSDRWCFSTWLYQIAINSYKDFRKRKRPRTEELLDDSIAAGSFLPEEYIENIEQQQMIKKMFDSLNEDVRTIMILRYYHGLSLKDIGDICKLSPHAVKMKIFRARTKLSRLYGGIEIGGESYEM